MQNDLEWVREVDRQAKADQAEEVDEDDVGDDDLTALDVVGPAGRFETHEFGVLEELLVTLLHTQVSKEDQPNLRELRPRTAWEVLHREQRAASRAYASAVVRRVTPEEFERLLADPESITATAQDGLSTGE